MNKKEILNAMDENHKVYIITEVGDPQNNEYTPLGLYVHHIDMKNGIAYLTKNGTDILDRSPFDEIYPTYNSALLAIDEITFDETANNIKSEVYNALSQIAFNHRNLDAEKNKAYIESAYEWFSIQFYENEYEEPDLD